MIIGLAIRRKIINVVGLLTAGLAITLYAAKAAADQYDNPPSVTVHTNLGAPPQSGRLSWKSFGVTPCQRLNAREKLLWSEKPSR